MRCFRHRRGPLIPLPDSGPLPSLQPSPISCPLHTALVVSEYTPSRRHAQTPAQRCALMDLQQGRSLTNEATALATAGTCAACRYSSKSAIHRRAPRSVPPGWLASPLASRHSLRRSHTAVDPRAAPRARLPRVARSVRRAQRVLHAPAAPHAVRCALRRSQILQRLREWRSEPPWQLVAVSATLNSRSRSDVALFSRRPLTHIRVRPAGTQSHLGPVPLRPGPT